MNWQQVANGDFLQITKISEYENSVDEGKHGKIVFNLRTVPSQDIVTQLQDQLNYHGVTDGVASADGNDLSVTYKKGFPWLAVIVGIVIGLIVLAILIVGWTFFKEIETALGPQGTSALIWIGVAVAIVAIIGLLYWYFKRR